MSYTKPLADRERALENAFFQKESQRLVLALRSRFSEEARSQALADALGVKNPAILEPLFALGLRDENVAALMMAPLVVLAWADQTLDNDERRMLLEAETCLGIERKSDADRLLNAWLDDKPEKTLLDAWSAYIAELRLIIPAADYNELREHIRFYAGAIATAIEKSFLRSGGPTRRERAILARIEEAFSQDGEPTPARPLHSSKPKTSAPLDDALRAMS